MSDSIPYFVVALACAAPFLLLVISVALWQRLKRRAEEDRLAFCPVPRCGGVALLVNELAGAPYYVTCSRCGLRTAPRCCRYHASLEWTALSYGSAYTLNAQCRGNVTQ